MIPFERFQLTNGLMVLLHEDHKTPMVAVNVLYRVGSRDDDPDKTGLAHLCEHLMFTGSKNISDFQDIVDRAGGIANAATSPDFTQYTLTVPADNLEVALWLTRDRMNGPDVNKSKIRQQQEIIVREREDGLIENPYTDAMTKLISLAYKEHPYKNPTIGISARHIRSIGLNDVTSFFEQYYAPNNAILVIAGKISIDEVSRLVEKWFADIPANPSLVRKVFTEPEQTDPRELQVNSRGYDNAIYKSFRIPGLADPAIPIIGVFIELLESGTSSYLEKKLVEENKIFEDIGFAASETFDDGILIFQGILQKDITFDQATSALDDFFSGFSTLLIADRDLERIKNQLETSFHIHNQSIESRAENLGFYELLGDAAKINTDWKTYSNLTRDELMGVGSKLFNKKASCTLHITGKK